jgi:hypothetical protein
MGTNLLGELVANNGTYFLNNGNYVGKIDQIIVRGIGINGINIYMLIDGQQTAITGQYLHLGDGTRLPDGLRITPKGDDVFTKVEVFSNTNVENGTGIELVLA